MKNVNIAHHPFRGNFTVHLNDFAETKRATTYFKLEQHRIHVTGGLVCVSTRGIRVQRLGQGVFFDPAHVRRINVGWRTIWPENKFLRRIKNLFAKIIRKFNID